MADTFPVSKATVQAVTQTMNLDLPDDRLDQLVTTLSAYLENLERLRQLDPGDCEPPAITFESEARP